MIICVGDSLTFGNVGYSYRKYLSVNGTVNKGFNGDPLMGIYKRLTKILKNPKYSEAKTYVIGGGTNDILLPALRHHSSFWKCLNTLRPAVMGYRYCCNENSFRYMYEKIIRLLLDSGKNIIIIGIPKCELGNISIDKKIQARNSLIQHLAEKYSLTYIDIYDKMSSLQPASSCKYNWGKTNGMRLFDASLMTLLPFTKDLFSKVRGLSVTVDGIHYNSRTAMELGNMVERAVLDETGTSTGL